jgi:hypothetical protein
MLCEMMVDANAGAEEERLPLEEGYKRPEKSVTVVNILGMVAKVVLAGI